MRIRGIDSPCKNCETRFVGCHTSCVKYIDYQQAQVAMNVNVMKKKAEARGYGYTEYIVGKHNERNRKKFKGYI